MMTAIIVSATLMFLYTVAAVLSITALRKQFIDLVMEHPFAVMVIGKLWWYGSFLTLVGCVIYHFVEKYW